MGSPIQMYAICIVGAVDAWGVTLWGRHGSFEAVYVHWRFFGQIGAMAFPGWMNMLGSNGWSC